MTKGQVAQKSEYPILEAFVTNLRAYNEGSLVGGFLPFPASEEAVQALLSKIGMDDWNGDYFITDYRTDVEGLFKRLGEYESLDELNYLSSLLSELDDWERGKFEAVLELGDYGNSVEEMINLAQNLDCFDYYPDICNEDELGHYLVDELECRNIPNDIEPYFDYEAFGRDYSINEGGAFACNGYIQSNGESVVEYYDGMVVPDEYKVSSNVDLEVKVPIKEQMERCNRLSEQNPPQRNSMQLVAER